MASWEKRGDDTYRLIAYCGYDSTGKKKTPKRKTIKITEKMSDKQLAKYLDKEAILFQEEVDKGSYLDASKIRFDEFSKRWLTDYAEKQLQPKTIAGYKDNLWRINQAIGHIKLDKLQPHHLTEFYNNLLENGVRLDSKYTLNCHYIVQIKTQKEAIAEHANINLNTLNAILKGNHTTYKIAGKLSDCLSIPVNKLFNKSETKLGLDPESVRHHHRVISSILSKAVKWQVILSNPATRAEIPKVKRKEAQSYDETQTLHMFELLADEPLKYQSAIYIALYGGLRLGEVTGLDWSDINFEKKTITVSKARQYVLGLGTYDKEPKTERSNREIRLSNGVLDILNEYKKEQEGESLRLGDKWISTGKIFTQWNGLPMFPQTPSKWFHKWIEHNNLPKITFHQLRHTHASILIANGVDIATVSKRMGHARISTTIDIYTHSIERKDTMAAEVLDDVLNLKSKGNNDCEPSKP